MERAGISLSMTYVVVGLILLTTAVTVILYVTGNINTLKGITQGQISESQKQLIETQCLNQQAEACQEVEGTGENWAQRASYKGKSCYEWAEQKNVFGGVESIPGC